MDVLRRSFESAALVLLGAAAACAAVLPALAIAQESSEQAPSPEQYPDESYISLAGTVVAVAEDALKLNFDGGVVTVEMDDAQRDDDYEFEQGDQITVYGEIDNDFFEQATIEPARIYLAKLDKYFYTDPAQELDVGFTADIDPTTMRVQGTVTEVNGGEFSISEGVRRFRVDVDDLEDNPLDDDGPRIRRGDVVAVTGPVDYDFIEGREIVATFVERVRRAAAGRDVDER